MVEAWESALARPMASPFRTRIIICLAIKKTIEAFSLSYLHAAALSPLSLAQSMISTIVRVVTRGQDVYFILYCVILNFMFHKQMACNKLLNYEVKSF